MRIKIIEFGLVISLLFAWNADAKCRLDLKSKWGNRCSLDINCENSFIEKTLKVDEALINDNIDDIIQLLDNVNHLHTCQNYNISEIYLALNFAGNNLTDFNIPYMTFSQVHELNISNNNIRTVENGVFNDVELTVLDLSFNQIENIEEHAFALYGYIGMLLLHNNNISSLHDVRFSEYRPINYIDFSHNAINDLEWLESEEFSHLETIIANHNVITELRNHFHQMMSLKKLNLADNLIKNIKTYTFTNLKLLEVLDLSNNEIDTLNPEMFSGLYSLKYLNISHNKIDGITAEYFTKSLFLSVLDLSYNNLGFFALFEGSLRSPIDYILLNCNNLLKSDVSAILTFPPKVHHVNLDGNKFPCRTLVHIAARELINKNSSNSTIDDYIEIDCSSGEQEETFIVGLRSRMRRYEGRMIVPNYKKEEDFQLIKHNIWNDSTALVEVKFTKHEESKIIVCGIADPPTWHNAGVAWFVSILIIVLLGLTIYSVWRFCPESPIFSFIYNLRFRRLYS